jgi:hypothetical protein
VGEADARGAEAVVKVGRDGLGHGSCVGGDLRQAEVVHAVRVEQCGVFEFDLVADVGVAEVDERPVEHGVHLACCCRQDAVTGSAGTSSAASGPKRSTYRQFTEWAAAEGHSLAAHM